jgi:hypothetical protein
MKRPKKSDSGHSLTIPTDTTLRAAFQAKVQSTIDRINSALKGKDVEVLEPVLARIGRGQQLPHWYQGLKTNYTLPNLDGKTIGSIVEMLLVAVLETHTFKGMKAPPLRINPARGVDLPDLNLGVKSPSKNFCTSEPYFSAYERLIGSEHDVLVLLTDYQNAKKTPPLRLQIIRWRYLKGTQVADHNLCRIALKHRAWLVTTDEARAQRVFRFLAYINQSDWRAKRLLYLVDHLQDETQIKEVLKKVEKHFATTNKQRLKKDDVPIPNSDLEALQGIQKVSPLHLGIIDAADNWVVDVRKDTARAPNDNEWQRLLRGPLDGMIGMSLALQWRYNFGPLFGAGDDEDGAE